MTDDETKLSIENFNSINNILMKMIKNVLYLFSFPLHHNNIHSQTKFSITFKNKFVS